MISITVHSQAVLDAGQIVGSRTLKVGDRLEAEARFVVSAIEHTGVEIATDDSVNIIEGHPRITLTVANVYPLKPR